jgi:hypothetical protein
MATADFLIGNSLSEESKLSYKKTFQSFRQFISDHIDNTVQPLPPVLSHLVLYIAFCFTKGLAVATVRTHIAALGFIFQLGGFTDITQHFVIKKQLQGFAKAKPSHDLRLPITPFILSRILSSTPHVTNSAFLNSLLQAMYLLAFHAFSSGGEITKTGKTNQHYLLRKHIDLVQSSPDAKLIQLTIPHAKHSTSPTTLQIPQNLEKPLLCPVRALENFMQLRGHESPITPLFSFIGGLPVSRQFFTQQLQLSLSYCGLDSKLYQAHSFRIGAATAAAQSGATDIQIQHMGRWRSTAFKKYIRVPVLKLNP